MDAFLDNAQRLFDVASSHGGAEASQFALLVRDDGGMHFIMESPVSIDGALAYGGARTAYCVTRSPAGIRVEGSSAGRSCVIEENRSFRHLLRDQPLYLIAPPLLTSAS
jgi:hypothetical protein